MGDWLIDEREFARFLCREPEPDNYGYAIASHRSKYRTSFVATQQMLMDAYVAYGLLFHNADMTGIIGR
jgi:hypothetical protein